ncbi:MAG TPA: tetratricopeptide repeat protein [Actinophytocola sp.]|nr:tetratricopeptide repeat protein [Actinophytocola sp.]
MNSPDTPTGPADAMPSGDTHSELSGRAGEVVQARDVSGGVHFHRAKPQIGPIPRQLPVDARVFVNRVAELEWLDQSMAKGGPACIIAGTAGVGKTSLAVHWAHRVRERFSDGQLYVNLRGYDPGTPVTPEQALDRFLRAMDVLPGAIPRDSEARAALYRSLLADRRVLVVLDNAASAGQVRPLLPGTDTCFVVITSRSRLSSLVAREGAHRLTLDVLPEPEAIALLRATINGFRHHDDPNDIGELARLCARLPLALRIAAERASSRPQTPLADLIQDLRDESALWDLLSSGDDEETGAVRTVFAWSYRALSTDAARLFRLLGLHPGRDFSSAAAAALTGFTTARARQLLDVLVGAHLLEQPDRDRFQFHDLLRAYAADQVRGEESPEDRHSTVVRLLTWYLHSADAAVAASMYARRRFPLDTPDRDMPLESFPNHEAALGWYDLERVNLVAATIAANNAGLYETAWRLPAILRGLFEYRHPFDEWFTTTRIGLSAARRVGDRTGEATLLFSLGKAHIQYGQLEDGLRSLEESLSIQRAVGDRLGAAESLAGAGLACLRLRRLPEAETRFEQSREIADELGEIAHKAFSTHLLGNTCFEQNRLGEAVEHLRQAAEMLRAIGNRTMEIDALVFLARAQREHGRVDEAQASAVRALKIADETGDRVITALSLVELGRLHLIRSNPAEALKCFQQATVLQRALGNRSREAQSLDATGEAYQRLGRPQDAAAFHRQAIHIQRALNERWWLAIALNNLATALSVAGEEDDAHRHWQEALALFGEFADARARSHLRQIQERLADTSTQ